jgi:transposase
MKQALIIEKSIPMATAKLDNASMPSSVANARPRVSGIAALKLAKLFAPMTFAGSCNRELFEQWLAECLVPQLQPGDIILIDNASFHRSQAIEEIVAEAGCEIWYLPPYSPDLNEIEHWWFRLNNWMRQRWDEFDSFRDCVDAAFKECPNVFA